MEQYAKYLRKSRFDRDYAEMSVEETLKRHEAILDRLAGERGYRVTKTYYEVVSGESIAARPEIQKLLEEISAAPTFTMPAKEKHAKSFVLLSQNVALNKTSGGRFYRSAMQGGMCDVMAYKNDSGDQSYVSWANKDGATYIFCIMQSPDTCDDYGYSNRRPALYETTKLIDWVFESFSIQAALDTDQALAEIPVKYSSDTDTLQLYPADSMMTLLPSTGDGSVTQKYFHLPDYATAPIQQGDVVGTVELKLAGETIGVVNLIAGQDVHQNALLFTVSKVQAFFHSLYLKVVVVLSLLTLAVYGLWVFINLWNGRRPNRKIHRR